MRGCRSRLPVFFLIVFPLLCTAEYRGTVVGDSTEWWDKFFSSLSDVGSICTKMQNAYVSLCPNYFLGGFCPAFQHAYLENCRYQSWVSDTYIFAIVYTATAAVSITISAIISRLKIRFIPESAASIFIGMAVGGGLRLVGTSEYHHILQSLFYGVLAPPIVLETGIVIHKGALWKHIGPILTLASVGTLSSIIVASVVMHYVSLWIGDVKLPWLESIVFACIASSTDPSAPLAVFESMGVDRTLHITVFGESMLNDTAAIVLYSVFSGFLGKEMTGEVVWTAIWRLVVAVFASAIVGSLCGICTWAFHRFIGFRHSPVSETLSLFLFCMIPYYCTNLLKGSGMITLLVEAIIVDVYTVPLLSPTGRRYFIASISTVARLFETTIFIYLGIELMTHSYHGFSWGIAVGALLASTLARACAVIPISFSFNCLECLRGDHSPRIPWNHQLMLCWAGMKGVIAFTLAVNIPKYDPVADFGSHFADEIVTTTTIMVVFSAFVMGGLTPLVVRILKLGEQDGVGGLDVRRLTGLIRAGYGGWLKPWEEAPEDDDRDIGERYHLLAD